MIEPYRHTIVFSRPRNEAILAPRDFSPGESEYDEKCTNTGASTASSGSEDVETAKPTCEVRRRTSQVHYIFGHINQ